MAHFPKPFFRPSRGLWYVQIDGRQVNLGPDKQAAFKRYHALMQSPTPVVAPQVSSSPLVVVSNTPARRRAVEKSPADTIKSSLKRLSKRKAQSGIQKGNGPCSNNTGTTEQKQA